MDPLITARLTELRFGEVQTYRNMSVIPLFYAGDDGPKYITLQEALAAKVIIITEIDPSGSVPEIMVINKSDQFIFLIDGEELMGAKQNRVLNTSILLKKKAKSSIPVSCTEQGRWSYSTAAFAYSGEIMSHQIRSSKLRTVSAALHQGRGHASNQRQVWAEIKQLHNDSGISSPTQAMRDVYRARSEDLHAYTRAFKYVQHQQGSLVAINGQIVGFDLISRTTAYRMLHPQLVRSYAMDALLQRSERQAEISLDKVAAFLRDAMNCRESKFEGVGQGHDFRYEGSGMIGTALVSAGCAIHVAFFRTSKNEPDRPASSSYL